MESIKSKSKDSYLERRKLFKNIWDAAAQMEEKVKESENAPSATKPKVIKTLRLGKEDTINVDKNNKKQRIKNLRIVCTRLLDICNKQETDDILYDQISAARHDTSLTSTMFAHRQKLKKKPKKKKKKKEVKKTYETQPIDKEDTISLDIDTDGPITHRGTIPVRHVIPPRIERATLIQQFVNERYKLETRTEQNYLGDAHRRVVKKKQNKRNILSTSSPPPRLGSSTKRVPTNKIEKKSEK